MHRKCRVLTTNVSLLAGAVVWAGLAVEELGKKRVDGVLKDDLPPLLEVVEATIGGAVVFTAV